MRLIESSNQWGIRVKNKFVLQNYYFMTKIEVFWTPDPELESQATVRFGQLIGITLWTPSPWRKEIKYPYIAYSYKNFPCIEWSKKGRACLHHIADVPENTYVYMSIAYRGYAYTSDASIGIVKEGSVYGRKEAWNAVNIAKVVEDVELLQPAQRADLALEASRRGWMISKENPGENLLAVWAVKTGLVSDKPVTVSLIQGQASGIPETTRLYWRLFPEMF